METITQPVTSADLRPLSSPLGRRGENAGLAMGDLLIEVLVTDIRTFKLKDLRLDDLPPDRRHLAEGEIRGMLGHFERLGDQLNLEHDVELDVVLAEDIAPHVDRIGQSYGKASAGPYSPTRNTVAAQGITLTHPNAPPLRTSVVLDQETWTRDDGESVA